MPAFDLVDQIREHTILKRGITRDSVIVDLGMNDGRFARDINARYGCKVVGVEPNAKLAIGIGISDSISCHNIAISSASGLVKFGIADDNEASHILSDGNLRPGMEIVEVGCVPLATFLSSKDITQVDLLKIDIEGAELEIFEGPDSDTLQNIKQISVEFHAFLDPAQRPRVQNIMSRMRERGFYCTDFSATWKDVLLLNEALLKISLQEKIALHYHKYAVGVPALLRKVYSEGPSKVTKKIIARRYSRSSE